MRRREYARDSGRRLAEAHLYASSQIIGTPAFYLSATAPSARTVPPAPWASSGHGSGPPLKFGAGGPIICLRPSRSPGAPRIPITGPVRVPSACGRRSPRGEQRRVSFIPQLTEFLRRGEDLPTLPEIVLELHAALDDELSSDRAITGIIERDPALASRLLRVANSAFFNLGDSIGTVLAAIQRLGVNRVRSICIVLDIVKWSSARPGVFNHREFWSHSAAVGLAAQHLSYESTLRGPADASDLYMAGLLHDVGILVLDQFFPERFQEVLAVSGDFDLPLWRLEAMVLGMDHGEIGGLLLGNWSLPSTITGIVTHHHHPATAPEQLQDACRLAEAAEILCSTHRMGVSVERQTGDDASEVLTALGFGHDEVEAIFAETDVIRNKAQGLILAA